MKKSILILILLIISNASLLAQSLEPQQRKLKYNGIDSTLFHSDSIPFPSNNNYLIGYHWTNNSEIATSVLSNQNNAKAQWMTYPNTNILDPFQAQDSCLLVIEGIDTAKDIEGVYSHVTDGIGVLNSRSMLFKPNMLVDDNDTQESIITKRPYDPSNPIFGFYNINPAITIAQDSGATNYSYLVIPDNTLKDSVIFSDPWGSEYLRKWHFDNPDTANPEHKSYFGYNYCLSINIKRTGAYYDNLMDGDQVLEIQLPYTLNDTNQPSGLIKFENVPTTTQEAIISTLYESRGRRTTLQGVSPNTTSIVITENMIPDSNSVVTITAKFRCWGVLDYEDNALLGFRNPKFSSHEGGSGVEIKKIGITATYRGGCPIAILDVSLSSPHALEVFEGKWDSTICAYIQDDINFVNRYDSVFNKHIRKFRFTDVTEASPQYFRAQRYVRKLLGDVWTGPHKTFYPKFYSYYADPPELSLQFWAIQTNINAPYIKKGQVIMDLRAPTLGFISGSTQKYRSETLTLTDQLNSVWETYPPFWANGRNAYNSYSDFNPFDKSKVKWLNTYDGTDSPTHSLQSKHDYDMWRNFYNDSTSGFQYLDKPWYAMTHNLYGWGTNNFNILDTSSVWNDLDSLKYSGKTFEYFDSTKQVTIKGIRVSQLISYNRPMTAEEARLFAYTSLIMGAKGLTYDGLSYGSGEDYMRCAHDSLLRLHPLDTEDYYEYLMRDELGGDYLDFSNESESDNPAYMPILRDLYLNMLKPSVNKEQLLQNSLGCSVDRIYIGRKSVRTELYKIHRFIQDNSSTIMNLRLMAAYNKGYLKLYNQHPDYPLVNPWDTLLNKYVKIANIKTRRIHFPNISGGYTLPTEENAFDDQTDTYFDITLLKEENIPLSDFFYVALQSRRTDPLVWRQVKTDNQSDTWDLCYYSGAELDYLSDYGGIDPLDQNALPLWHNAEYWQDKYRKRLGNREISVEFEKLFTSFGKPAQGYLIESLNYNLPCEGTEKYDDLKYWQKDAYKHNVWNFYPMSLFPNSLDTVIIKFLPGQGRIFRVTPYYNIIWNIIERKDTLNTNPIDTCEVLRNDIGVGFFKESTGDANDCKYRVYFCNYSDSLNFNVPIGINIQSEDSIVITNADSANFRYINNKTALGYQSYWIPNGMITQDTTLIGYIQGFCDSSKVVYTVGMRDCYRSDTLMLLCKTCDCCNLVNTELAPITTQISCYLRPYMSQTTMLTNGESCFYYGLTVSGGFTPNDSLIIPDLSVFYNPLNPQPINFPAYIKQLTNQFNNIYCYPSCTYCLHFEYVNINNDVVCKKDVCITIDNTQTPVEIDPSGSLSDDCIDLLPAKRNIPTEELHFEQQVIVDPNPTSGKTNIKLNLENDLVGRLVLYSSTGELIQEIHNGKLTKGTTDYEINLSDYPSGMYIITIESDGMSYIKKFVKE